MRKKIIFSAFLVLMVSVFVSADTYVGDLISPTLDMTCALTIDTDLSDGEGIVPFYSYTLTDPTNTVRLSAVMQPYDKARVLIAGNFDVDMPGAWVMKGEYAYIEYSGYSMVDFGICDTDQITVDVFPEPVCGNAIIEDVEECDDGNTASNDGCSDTCVIEFCGDGIIQTSEECDGGSTCDAGCNLIDVPTSVSFTLDQRVNPFILEDANTRSCYYEAWDRDYCKNSNTGRSKWLSLYKSYATVPRGSTRIERIYQKIDLTAIKEHPSYSGSVQQTFLILPTTGWGEGESIDVYNIDLAWSESTLTHANQPCLADFSACSGYTKINNVAVNTAPNNMWRIHITTLVNEALADGQDVLNLVYKFEDEGDRASPMFRETYSKEALNYRWQYYPSQELEVLI